MLSAGIAHPKIQLQPIEVAFDAFVRTHAEFAATGKLDQLRTIEYGRLDRQGHVYLDYTGGALSAYSG